MWVLICLIIFILLFFNKVNGFVKLIVKMVNICLMW